MFAKLKRGESCAECVFNDDVPACLSTVAISPACQNTAANRVWAAAEPGDPDSILVRPSAANSGLNRPQPTPIRGCGRPALAARIIK